MATYWYFTLTTQNVWGIFHWTDSAGTAHSKSFTPSQPVSGTWAAKANTSPQVVVSNVEDGYTGTQWAFSPGSTYNRGTSYTDTIDYYSSGVSRSLTITATGYTPTTYDYYYQPYYYVGSTSKVVGVGSVVHETSTADTGLNVQASTISAITGLSKTNSYEHGRYCTYSNGWFTISTDGTSQTPAICYIGVTINSFGNWTSNDATYIASGKAFNNITHGRWNDYQTYLSYVCNYCGVSFTKSDASTGTALTATRFNQILSALRSCATYLSYSGTIISNVSQGGTVYAWMFHGSTSIKSILNSLITLVNT